VNLAGIRQMAWFQNLTVVLKFLPLLVVGVAGWFFVRSPGGWPRCRRPTASSRRRCSARPGTAGPPARLQVEEVARQCAAWSEPENSFYSGLVQRLTGVPDALRGQLDAAARVAAAATAGLGAFLSAELLPLAREKDACGPEVYARASRSRRIDGRENFRAWMQELADRTISQLHGTHFDIPEPAHRIEAMIAPADDGGIYYTEPSEDWSRPGRLWWSVPAGIDTSSTWKEVTAVYHEGVPGHHLQISQVRAEQENLNRWQRLMCWVSGCSEGWARYAERLMGELGYLDDPGPRFGMLYAQLTSAAIAALDIGVHLELEIPKGTGWREGGR
jgi:uncharacterized protein (DUF885 family)